jgi:hypothetical protein
VDAFEKQHGDTAIFGDTLEGPTLAEVSLLLAFFLFCFLFIAFLFLFLFVATRPSLATHWKGQHWQS